MLAGHCGTAAPCDAALGKPDGTHSHLILYRGWAWSQGSTGVVGRHPSNSGVSYCPERPGGQGQQPSTGDWSLHSQLRLRALEITGNSGVVCTMTCWEVCHSPFRWHSPHSLQRTPWRLGVGVPWASTFHIFGKGLQQEQGLHKPASAW